MVPALKLEGSFTRFDKKFDGKLADLIRKLNTYIYEGFDADLKDYVFDGLRFHFSQLTLFRYISDCILAHNMWKADKKDESCYRYFGLNELIGEQFPMISIEKNPLLFILALVDTIEPIKMRPLRYLRIKAFRRF